MIIPVLSISHRLELGIHATLESFRGRIGLRSAILINCIRRHSSKASLRGGRIWDTVGPSRRSTRRKPLCAPGCALLQANISLTAGSMPTRPSFAFSVQKTASNISICHTSDQMSAQRLAQSPPRNPREQHFPHVFSHLMPQNDASVAG